MQQDLSPAFDPSGEITFGEATGRAKIVWFIDFTCPKTRRMRDVLVRSAERFGTHYASLAVRLVTEEPGSASAQMAARAGIAAHWQGRYAEMHARLFRHNGPYDKASVLRMARQIGLDLTRFDADLHSARTEQKLAADQASFQASNVRQLPAMFIDGQRYDGVWDEVSIIDAIERPLGVRLHLASESFFRWAASAGFVLVLATVLALLIVNLGGGDAYAHLRHLPFGLSLGEGSFALPLEVWINDGLMTLFFLLVGIEIKREMVSGELSSREKAAMPIIAAIGGMVVPAAIYAVVNLGQDTAHGWGVPMATDIAFTLGLMALLGSRVPTSLKVFVSALAIADDLGAIVVIAIFYGHGFHLEPFLIGLAVFAAMLALNVAHIYSRIPYMILFVVLWAMVHESGLHATLAGVLTAIAIPARRSADIEAIAAHADEIMDKERRRHATEISEHSYAQLSHALERLREPGFHLQFSLERWCNYLILPLFAFFNTGIVLIGAGFTPLAPEALGIILGLVIGKPLGIVGGVLLATRLGLARLSSEISLMQLLGAGFLAGIGFTMSIFIGSAAFEGAQLMSVKLSILLASTFAALVGMAFLVRAARA